MINFQGKLVNSSGLNVANGNYDIVFALYDADGTSIWSETWNSGTSQVAVQDGVFRVALGTHSSLAGINFNQDSINLGVKVGADAEMTPRIRFTAVPYAFVAKTVEDDALDFAQLQDTLDLDANLTVNQTGYTWSQTYTGTSAPGLSYTASGAVTSGNAAALDVNVSNASTTVPAMMITNAGSGYALRVNDDGTTTDSTPLIVDANGNLGIGTTSPTGKLNISYTQEAGPFLAPIVLTPTGETRIALSSYFGGGSMPSGALMAASDFGSSTSPLHLYYKSGVQGSPMRLDLWGNTTNLNSSTNIYYTGGNVGIGTTAPGSLLSVGGVGTSGRGISGYATSSSNVAIEGVEQGGVHALYLRPNTSGINLISSNYLSGSAYLPLSLSGRENTSDLVLNAGNVGIGTTNPTTKLDLRGTTGTRAAYFDGRVRGEAASSSDEYVTLSQLGGGGGPWSRTAPFTYLTTGTDNVGIGTTTPGTKLEIAGGLAVTGINGFISSPYAIAAPKTLVGVGTGALTSVATTATGTNPYSVAADPTGRFVYVTNMGSTTVQAYTIDPSTSVLTSVGTTATGTNPIGVATDPTGRFVYVTNNGSTTVQAYTINQSTGALTSVGTTATGTQPLFVAVDPTGRFVYVTNRNATTVQAYTINQSTGALTSVGTTATGTQPYGVAVDPTGRFVYVTNYGATTVQAYTINQTTGALTSVGTTATGLSPYSVAVDPTGRFAYVANTGADTVQTYTINQSTGALTSVGTTGTGSNPRGVTVDPTGRLAYVTNYGATSVQAYTINQSTGILTSLETIATGTNPIGVAVDPTGRFIYVANYGSTTVQAHTINNFSAGSAYFAGNVGIGTTSPIALLNTYKNQSDETRDYILALNDLQLSLNADSTSKYYAQKNSVDFSGVQYTADSLVGSYNLVDGGGSGGIATNLIGSDNYVSTSNNSTNLIGVRSVLSEGSGDYDAVNGYGMYIDAAGGFTGRLAGLYIDDLNNYLGDAYGMYQSGSTDSNYFAGNVGIGTSAPQRPLMVESPNSSLALFMTTGVGEAKIEFGNVDDTGTLLYQNGLVSLGRSGSLSPDNLNIDISGNVGIGTTSPEAKLDVTVTNDSLTNLYGVRSAVNGGSGEVYSTNAYGLHSSVYGGINAYGLYIGDVTSAVGLVYEYGIYQSDNQNKNYFAGSVGIGTTNPRTKLDVFGSISLSGGGTTHPTFSIDPSGGGLVMNVDGAGGGGVADDKLLFEVRNDGPAKLTVLGSGNVGIGTTAPGQKLEVAGGIAATGINGFISSPYAIAAPKTLVGVGTGALTSVGTTATETNPRGVAVDPTGRFAYVANYSSTTVQAYTINQSTGALTSVGTTATGTNPRGVAVDPTGRFAYVVNTGSTTVQAYTINQSTGILTSVGTTATGTAPWVVAVDPTGRFAYVANSGSTTVQAYTINQSTGALTSVGTTATGTSPRGVAVDPTGRFAYVTNYSSTTVQAYTINQSTGVLTSVGTTATGTNPAGITVDPTGRFAYVTNYSSTTVQAYTINQSTGALTSVGTTASGTSPWAVAVDPTGRFAYVTNSDATTVQAYTINQSTGALTSVGTTATGTNPWEVVVDPTGRFAYVTNLSSTTVQAYTINNFSAGSAYFAGNLGIGTTAPNFKLDLNGSFNLNNLVKSYGTNNSTLLVNAERTKVVSTGFGVPILEFGTNATINQVRGQAVVGDFNNDGLNDMANGNYGTGTISVYLKNKDGSFAAPTNYSVGTNVMSIEMGDLDNDGWIDLVAIDTTNNNATVFINNKNGTFATGVTYATNATPYHVVVKDVTNDGYADFVVSCLNTSASLHINNGNGTFATHTDVTSVYSDYGLAARDMNNDGYADLVSTDASTNVKISINNKNGTFAAAVTYPTQASSSKVTVDDFNKDGWADVAVTHNGGTGVSVLLNDGDGTLGAATYLTTGCQGGTITSADLDRDTDIDIASTCWNGTTGTHVFMNNGNGTFAAQAYYPQGGGADITAGDINDDGYPDLIFPVYALSRVQALLNRKDGTFAKPLDSYATVNDPDSIISGDVNNDGYPDVVVMSEYSSGTAYVGVHLQNSSGTYTTMAQYPIGSGSDEVVLGDVNNDGYLDIAVTNSSDSNVSVLINNKDGTFAARVNYSTSSDPRHVVIGDVNNDSWADMAVGSVGGNNVSVFINNKNGTFANAANYGVGTAPVGLAIGDVNRDGFLDLVSANYTTNNISVLINNKNNTFATKVDYAAGTGTREVSIADFNKDGFPDVTAINRTSDTVSVFINNKNGTFATKVDYPTGKYPQAVAAKDMTGDGFADLVVASTNLSAFSVYANNKDGTFASRVNYSTYNTRDTYTAPYRGMDVADMNSDGYNDVIVAYYAANTFSVFINGTSANEMQGDLALSGGLYFKDIDTGIKTLKNDTLTFMTGGINRLTLDASGNLGLGTTAPTNEIEINKSITSTDDATLAYSYEDFTNWTVSLQLPYADFTHSIKSMTRDSTNNVLYAATGGGDGLIYRCLISSGCDASADWTMVYDTSESSINSMVFDSTTGVIYAGTGDSGLIYRCAVSTGCDVSGDWSTSYDTAATSINTMFFDYDLGIIYASGSDNNMYRCSIATSGSCNDSSDWTSYATTGNTFNSFAYYSWVPWAVQGVIYATSSVADGDVYRCATSTACDAWADWTVAYNNTGNSLNGIVIDTDNADLYAYATNSKMFRCDLGTSCDADVDWTNYTLKTSAMVYDSIHDTLYADRSTDDGIYICRTSSLCDAAEDWSLQGTRANQQFANQYGFKGMLIDSTGVIYGWVNVGSRKPAIMRGETNYDLKWLTGVDYSDYGSFKISRAGQYGNAATDYLTIDNLGNVGIGGISPFSKFNVVNTSSTSPDYLYGVSAITDHHGTSEITTNYGGIFGAKNTSSGSTVTGGGVMGYYVTDTGSTATVPNGFGAYGQVISIGSAITEAIGVKGEAMTLGANMTNAYAGRFDTSTMIGSIGTGYGVYASSTGATTNFGVYSAAGTNYFNGNVGIGTTVPSSQLQVSSTSTSTGYTGFGLDWSPGSATTATGDLLGVNIGPNGNAANLFNIKDSGSSLFSVSETQVTSNLPVVFNATGDVSVAYDLLMNNQTSSNIKSNGPLTIDTGENWESNNLTLKTYNSGSLILNSANLWADGTNVGIGTTAPGALLQLGTAGTSLGTLRLTGNTSGYTQIQPAAAAGTWSLTLPTNDGDANQVLTTDGNGLTSWTTSTGGGANTALSNLSSVAINTSLISDTADTDDLGSTTLEWNSLFLADGSGLTAGGGLFFGNDQDILLTYDETTSDALEFSDGTNTFMSIKDQGTAADIAFNTNTLFIGNTGNVGIGTTNPTAKLSIAGTSNISNATGDLTIIPAANLIISQGNVGIGTTSPQAKLHTVGGTYNYGSGDVNGDSNVDSTDGLMILSWIGDAYTLSEAEYGRADINGDGSVDRLDADLISAYGASMITLAEARHSVGKRLSDSIISRTYSGEVGIGTDDPSYILSLGGTAARTFGMNRNSTAATAGQGLTITSGGAIAGTSDLAGGDLTLSSGISTGTGSSALHFLTATAGTTGSTDRTPTEKMTILGSGFVGIGTTAPDSLLSISNGNGTIEFQPYIPGVIENSIYSDRDLWISAQTGSTIFNAGGANSSIAITDTSATQILLNSSGDSYFNGGNVGIGTTVPTSTLHVGGTTTIGAQTDSASTGSSTASLNSPAGTFGGASAIDKVSSSIVYRNKLFVATAETNNAGVYRFDGGTTWTLVTNSVGKAVSADAQDADAFIMTVYNDKLYIANQTGAATGAIYYSSSADTTANSFTMLNATRGTSGMGQTTITGYSDMTVFNGRLYVATQLANLAEIGFWASGTTFTQVTPTDGKAVAETLVDKDGFILEVYNGILFAGGITGSNTASVSSYNGSGTTWVMLNTSTGGGGLGAESAYIDITSMTVFNGNLYIAASKTDAAAVYMYKMGVVPVANVAANFQRVNTTVGKLIVGDTANIDSIVLSVYNGRLYAASSTGANSAALYEYPGGGLVDWTLMNTTRGTFGSNGNVDGVSTLTPFGGVMYIGTNEVDIASVYTWTKVAKNSYELRFDSGSQNYGSITFVGNTQENSNAGNTGSFNFSNAISLSSGSFDYAEDYPTTDATLVAGEIVSIDPNTPEHVQRAQQGNAAIGVISTNPGFRLSSNIEAVAGAKWVPIALVGRVPVKVSAENGPIQIGDNITLSSIAGVAMKATQSGMMLGQALTSFEGPGTGEITLFINSSFVEVSTDIDPYQDRIASIVDELSQVSNNVDIINTSLASIDYSTQISAITSVIDAGALNFTTLQQEVAQLKTDVQTLKADSVYTREDLASVSASLSTLHDEFMTWKDMLASSGAILGTASPSAALLEKVATVSAMTIEDDLQVDGKTSTFDLTVLNKLLSGVITIGGGSAGNEINTSGSLKFQTLSQGPVDFMNGKVVIDVDGSIKAKRLKIDTRDPKSSTAGKSLIPAGDDSYIVNTTAITTKSMIYVTINNDYTPATRYWIAEQVPGKSFTLRFDESISTTVEFSWFVVN